MGGWQGGRVTENPHPLSLFPLSLFPVVIINRTVFRTAHQCKFLDPTSRFEEASTGGTQSHNLRPEPEPEPKLQNARICVMLLAWCLVLGAWFLVLGAWCLVLGAWCLVLASFMGRGM